MRWVNKFKYPLSTKIIQNLYEDKIPSVSKILKETMSEEKKKALQNWIDKVGREEANKVKVDASKRGDFMHQYIEQFLKNEILKPEKDQKAFEMAKVIINNGLKNNLEEIWKTEAVLHYPERYIGITDLVGVMNAKTTIIDFKQSNNPKQEKFCDDYFLQLAAYIMAHDKVYNTKISQGIILLSTENYMFQRFDLFGEKLDFFKKLFLEKTDEYFKKF